MPGGQQIAEVRAVPRSVCWAEVHALIVWFCACGIVCYLRQSVIGGFSRIGALGNVAVPVPAGLRRSLRGSVGVEIAFMGMYLAVEFGDSILTGRGGFRGAPYGGAVGMAGHRARGRTRCGVPWLPRLRHRWYGRESADERSGPA